MKITKSYIWVLFLYRIFPFSIVAVTLTYVGSELGSLTCIHLASVKLCPYKRGLCAMFCMSSSIIQTHVSIDLILDLD